MIQFLKKLWKALKQFTLDALNQSTPDKDGTDNLNPNERISRFIYHKNDWNKQPTPKPKPKIFRPMMEAGQLETSVCRISNVSEQRIWEIANRTRPTFPVLARADLPVCSVIAERLNVVPAPDIEADYPEHAVIVGWPDDKDKQMAIALQLVSSSTLVFA